MQTLTKPLNKVLLSTTLLGLSLASHANIHSIGGLPNYANHANIGGLQLQKQAVAQALNYPTAIQTTPQTTPKTTPKTTTVTQDKTKPVLLVHGFMTYDIASVDCQVYFKDILNELKNQGFTNVKTITYYKNSQHCDVNLSQNYGVGRDNTWKELGGALSRYIFDNYSRYGQPVDLLGHSMGGLVMRSAIQGGNEYQQGFKNILVEDAVTIATPHLGTDFAKLCIYRQCKALQSENIDFRWLSNQKLPMSAIKTDWTVLASNFDMMTPLSSGIAMDTPVSHRKIYSGLSHTAILSNRASVQQAVRSLGTASE